MTAAASLVLASALAVGPGLGTDRIAAARFAPAAPPPTAAEGDAESAPPDGGEGGDWGEDDEVPEDTEWGEGDTVPDGTTDTGPATGAPATGAPAAGTPATGAPADGTVAGGSGITKKPAPPPDKQKRGLGLIIAAAGVGGVAWAMSAAQAAIISKSCIEDADGSDPGGTISSCITQAGGLIALTAFKWIPNATTYGLAPGAGIVRGRYEAADFVYSGNHDRNGTLFAGLGGGLLGLGIIGKVVMWALVPRTFACPTNPIEDYGPCVRRRWAGYFIGQQVMSSSIAAGAGLLAFGIYYNKERAARERLFFRPDNVRIVPNFQREFAGVSLAGRF